MEETPAESPDEQRDEEGLLTKYDVIICGTGLVQSILSSALARAGKSVLHCDGSDNYGELDAVWNLSMIQEKQQQISSHNPSEKENVIPILPNGGESSLRWHSTKKTTYCGIQIGSAVQTPFGTGIVKAIPKSIDDSLTVALDKWKLADGKTPLAFFRLSKNMEFTTSEIEVEKNFFQAHGIQSLRTAKAKEILQKERFLALDATPAFVLAAGKAVAGMLASNVADYIEFMTITGLFWLEQGKLSKVPCSKNDVFGTKLLTPMEKRRLMKFIQLSMDYATQLSAAEEIIKQSAMDNKEQQNSKATSTTTLNDNTHTAALESDVQSLNERHLNQGRSLARPQNKAVETEQLQILQACMEEGMSFDDFLEQKHKLSTKLRQIVRYALAWEQDVTSTSLSQGMAILRQHLQALGRFGTTAFIFPMYGSGELSQAFCRSAAVFGATYLLRRSPSGISVSKDNKVEGVFVLGDKLDDSSHEKHIHCSTAVVAPLTSIPEFQAMARSPVDKKILRRICILSDKLIKSNDGDRHVIFIPPKCIGNNAAIHCVTLDSTVQVAPQGATVMHLTTTVDCHSKDDVVDDDILTKASQIIIKASQSKEIHEVYHVAFSHDLVDSDNVPSPLPEGLYLCHHSGQVLTADVAFEQAQRIFSKICPGKEFLGLSDELDSCIKERAAERGYNDDERLVLESALDMIGEQEKELDALAIDEEKE